MKLFLTATSERGKPITKSGNDWLKIEVVDENRKVIFSKTIETKQVYLNRIYNKYDKPVVIKKILDQEQV